MKSLKDYVIKRPDTRHLNVKLQRDLIEEVEKAAKKLNLKLKQYVEAALRKALQEK